MNISASSYNIEELFDECDIVLFKSSLKDGTLLPVAITLMFDECDIVLFKSSLNDGTLLPVAVTLKNCLMNVISSYLNHR